MSWFVIESPLLKDGDFFLHKNFSPVITCSNLSGKKVAREYRPARCTSTKLPENIAPADLRCSAFNKSLTRYIWNTFIHNVILHSNQNNLLCSKFTKQSSTAYLFGKEQFSLFGVHA